MQRPFTCGSGTGEAEAEDEVPLVQATSQFTGRAGCGRSSFAASALALRCIFLPWAYAFIQGWLLLFLFCDYVSNV